MTGSSRPYPVRFDRVFGDIRLHEILLIMFVSIAGGALLAAAATWYDTLRGDPSAWPLGAGAGLVASPATLFVLFRRRYLLSAALLYGGPLLVATASSPIRFGIVSIPLTAIAWLVAAGCIIVLFPKHTRPLHCCAVCEYDLRGNTSGVCPECGAAIDWTAR